MVLHSMDGIPRLRLKSIGWMEPVVASLIEAEMKEALIVCMHPIVQTSD